MEARRKRRRFGKSICGRCSTTFVLLCSKGERFVRLWQRYGTVPQDVLLSAARRPGTLFVARTSPMVGGGQRPGCAHHGASHVWPAKPRTPNPPISVVTGDTPGVCVKISSQYPTSNAVKGDASGYWLHRSSPSPCGITILRKRYWTVYMGASQLCSKTADEVL